MANITGGFDVGKVAGRTKQGSVDHWRKASAASSAASMANVVAGYNQIIQNLKQATPQILQDAMEPAFLTSLDYVPVDTGSLQASGTLESGWEGKDKARAWITYGNAGVWYAAIVHERVDVRHAAGRGSKFLSRAMDEHIGDFMQVIGEKYEQVLR